MRVTLFVALAVLVGCGQPDEPTTVEVDDGPDVLVDPEPSDAGPVDPAAFAGEWTVDLLAGESDSVLTTVRFMAGEPDSPVGWTVQYPHLDEPVLAQDVMARGDALVIRYESFPSAFREGLMVLEPTTRSRVDGDAMTGTYEASYSNGDAIAGRLRGRRL